VADLGEGPLRALLPYTFPPTPCGLNIYCGNMESRVFLGIACKIGLLLLLVFDPYQDKCMGPEDLLTCPPSFSCPTHRGLSQGRCLEI